MKTPILLDKLMKMRFLLFVLAGILTGTFSFAQDFNASCGHSFVHKLQMENNPEYKAKYLLEQLEIEEILKNAPVEYDQYAKKAIKPSMKRTRGERK